MESGIYASLDIGTTSIKVIAAEVLNGQINVIGVGNEHSNGLRRGMIVDIDQTAASIRHAVEQAEDKADIQINELIVGIPVNNLGIDSCYGSISVNKNHQEITDQDVQKVIEKAIEGSLNQERDVVNLTLDEFTVDGFEEIQDPRGMIGDRIEFRGTLTSISRSILHNIRKAVDRAGYGIKNIILQPDAMAQLALDEDERDFGSILIDMGGGQTSVSVVHDQQLKFAHVIQEGGEYISRDISIVLNTSIKNADKLKRDIGHAYSPEANPERMVSVEVVGQNKLVQFKESYIAEIIEARLEQIFDQLKYALDNIGASNMPAGIIISGGTASIPGIEHLAENIFEIPVRTYIPDFMSVRYPTFTNAIGLVVKETSLSEIERLVNETVLRQTLSGQTGKTNRQAVIKESQNENTEAQNEQLKRTPETNDEETLSEKIRDFFSGFFE